MPYLMGGYPDPERRWRACEAAVDAGADLIELGVPFSDPLADGPVIHAAGHGGARAGRHPADVLRECESVATALPVVLMVYANVMLAAGLEAYARTAAAAGAAGMIVPDLPHDEAGELRAACDAAGHRAGAAGGADHHRRAGGGDRRGRPRLRLHRVAHRYHRGAHELPHELTATVDRVRAATEMPVAVGFGISTGARLRGGRAGRRGDRGQQDRARGRRAAAPTASPKWSPSWTRLCGRFPHMAETTTEKKPAAAKKPAKPRRSARVKAVEEAAQTYMSAVTARDPAGMAACWHPDGVEDIIPLGVFRGPEAVRALFTELFAAFPDFEFSVTRITADHECAAVQWRATGTFTGRPFQGIEPDRQAHRAARHRLRGGGRGGQDHPQHRRLRRRRVGSRDRAPAGPRTAAPRRRCVGAFNAVTKLRKAVEGAR